MGLLSEDLGTQLACHSIRYFTAYETASTGVDTRAVEEVVEFVRSGGVLQCRLDESCIPRQYPYVIIESLTDAEAYRDGYREGSKIVGEASWWDVSRELISPLETRLHPYLSQSSDNLDIRAFLAYVDEYDAEIENQLQPRLEPMIGWQESLQVRLHLKDILVVRGLNGVTENFAEWMFQVYKAGGHIVGYEGEYPYCRLVIYSLPNAGDHYKSTLPGTQGISSMTKPPESIAVLFFEDVVKNLGHSNDFAAYGIADLLQRSIWLCGRYGADDLQMMIKQWVQSDDYYRVAVCVHLQELCPVPATAEGVALLNKIRECWPDLLTHCDKWIDFIKFRT
ncbi:hypothetical protein GC163_01510 [bacterium]|nr:hypothetical protein [bacterium]